MANRLRLASLLTAAALLTAVSIPVASASGDSALAAKKKCKAKGKSGAAGKKKCKKKGSGKPTTPPPGPAQLTITPTSHNYGFLPPPWTPPIKTFAVKNVGGADSGPQTTTLQDNSTFGAAPTNALSITSNTCGALAPIVKGATCHIGVSFNPGFMAGVTGNGILTVAAQPGGTVVATMTGSS